METKSISRRQLLKGTGALVVGFSFWGPASRAFAQAAGQSAVTGSGDLDAAQLDSWLAIAQDGKVTVFTSKVELGTGVETALAQMVAEELDVPFQSVYMDSGDTDRSVDQAVTAGSRTLERAGPQLRQAAAAVCPKSAAASRSLLLKRSMPVRLQSSTPRRRSPAVSGMIRPRVMTTSTACEPKMVEKFGQVRNVCGFR